MPTQSPQQFADGHFADTDAPSDLTVRTTTPLQPLNPSSSRGPQAAASFGKSAALTQGSQPSVFEPPLTPSYGAHGIAEDAGHIILISPSLLDQADHGICLRHPVARCRLGQDDSRNHDDTVAILAFDRAAVVNNASAFWVLNDGKKVITMESSHAGRGYAGGQKSGQFWVRGRGGVKY
jgi:hypothetical protein